MTPADLALTVGATARLTRLVTGDDLGRIWLRDPAYQAAVRHTERAGVLPWWDKYRAGLSCPHCWGYWAGVLVYGAYAATTGRPRARAVWRLTAGTLALNAAVTTVGAKLNYWE